MQQRNPTKYYPSGKYNLQWWRQTGIFYTGEENGIAGVSAKKAPTKIETVKGALFLDTTKAEVIKKAFRKYKPQSLLILGTSDDMIKKIMENSWLMQLEEYQQQRK